MQLAGIAIHLIRLVASIRCCPSQIWAGSGMTTRSLRTSFGIV